MYTLMRLCVAKNNKHQLTNDAALDFVDDLDTRDGLFFGLAAAAATTTVGGA